MVYRQFKKRLFENAGVQGELSNIYTNENKSEEEIEQALSNMLGEVDLYVSDETVVLKVDKSIQSKLFEIAGDVDFNQVFDSLFGHYDHIFRPSYDLELNVELLHDWNRVYEANVPKDKTAVEELAKKGYVEFILNSSLDVNDYTGTNESKTKSTKPLKEANGYVLGEPKKREIKKFINDPEGAHSFQYYEVVPKGGKLEFRWLGFGKYLIMTYDTETKMFQMGYPEVNASQVMINFAKKLIPSGLISEKKRRDF